MENIRSGLRRTGWLPRAYRREEYVLFGGLRWPRYHTARCSGCGRMRRTRSHELHFEVRGAGMMRFKMTNLCDECSEYVLNVAFSPIRDVV